VKLGAAGLAVSASTLAGSSWGQAWLVSKGCKSYVKPRYGTVC